MRPFDDHCKAAFNDAVRVKAITEAEFQRQVLDLARLFGWTRAHFRAGLTRSGRWITPVQADAKGFPDLLLLRPPRIVAAELKVGKNQPTPEQEAWLALFNRCGAEAYLWYPSEWEEIEATLKP